MAFSSASVTVETAATALWDADEDVSSRMVKVPSDGATVYVGGSDVTTASGTPIDAGGTLEASGLLGGEVLYGIVASGTQTVTVLSQGV